jgi:hypothetical protein
LSLAEQVKQVSAGHYTSALLSLLGQVFLFGHWREGSQQQRLWTPQSLWAGSWRFESIAISEATGLGLTSSGQLYKWSGGLVPAAVLPQTRFTHIACGTNHQAAISEDNILHSWSFGQVLVDQAARPPSARPETTNSPPFLMLTWHHSELSLTKVPLPFRTKELAVTWKAALLLSEKGDIHLYGQGSAVSSLMGEAGSQRISSFSGTTFTGLTAGPEHVAATFEVAPDGWAFKEALLDLQGWQAIGTGRTPPRKVALERPRLLESAGTCEFRRAVDLFNRLHGDRFEISEIFCVENRSLEAAFHTEVEKLTNKWRDFPQLFRSEGWKSEANAEIKQGMLQELDKFSASFTWNKSASVPVIPALHCPDESAVWAIMSAGFSVLSSRDDGRFGRGIYLTTDAEYAATYCKDPVKTFVLCLALPGNAYPTATELRGEPPRRGYQSHYVRLRDGQPGLGARADELVVFQENQILPRYVIRATQRSVAQPASGPQTFVIPRLMSASKFPHFLKEAELWYRSRPNIEYKLRRDLDLAVASVRQWLAVNSTSQNLPPTYGRLVALLERLVPPDSPPSVAVIEPPSAAPEPPDPPLPSNVSALERENQELRRQLDFLTRELAAARNSTSTTNTLWGQVPIRPRPSKRPVPRARTQQEANRLVGWGSGGLWLPGLGVGGQ